MCNKVFDVYSCFAAYFYCFAEKMDTFHFGLVKPVGTH